MQSIESKLICCFLGFINFKKRIEKSLQKASRSVRKLNSSTEFRAFSPQEFCILGKEVITLTPTHCKNDYHILFFHGGAYVFEGSSMHRKLVTTIATKAFCRVSYVDYPLAPENTFRETFEMVQQAFLNLIKNYPNDKFVFMGDSAGGGLALAFAQKLIIDNSEIQPDKLILFSPWIDLSMANPNIKNIQKRDKILTTNGLKFTAIKYAGGEDLSDYLLSPLHGNFEKLCRTMVFYGTEEILYPDIELLKEKTNSTGNFIFKKYEGMQHDWVILPIPEATFAIEEAVKFLLDF